MSALLCGLEVGRSHYATATASPGMFNAREYRPLHPYTSVLMLVFSSSERHWWRWTAGHKGQLKGKCGVGESDCGMGRGIRLLTVCIVFTECLLCWCFLFRWHDSQQAGYQMDTVLGSMWIQSLHCVFSELQPQQERGLCGRLRSTLGCMRLDVLDGAGCSDAQLPTRAGQEVSGYISEG